MTVLDKVLETGFRLYDLGAKRRDLPVNQRVFLETFVDGRRGPVTEVDLKSDELKEIQKLVFGKYERIRPLLALYKAKLIDALKSPSLPGGDRKVFESDLRAIRAFEGGTLTRELTQLAASVDSKPRQALLQEAFKNTTHSTAEMKVKPVVHYSDYAASLFENAPSIEMGTRGDGFNAIQTFLGTFAFQVSPNNQTIVAKDVYDFDPLSFGDESRMESAVDAVKTERDVDSTKNKLYSIVREYAGEILPPGKGRDVEIRVPSRKPDAK
jgi:hypothetical protein